MKFGKILPPLLQRLQESKVDFAFIGGIAVYLAGVDRTTKDIDFLALLADSDKVNSIMKELGYETLQRSEDVANYYQAGPDGGRVDMIFSHRPPARAMLQRATRARYLNFDVKTLRPEDLIGLKIQALTNDPSRERKDLYDIEDLMSRHGKNLDWDLIREYYALFKRKDEFEVLRKKYQ